MSECRDTVIKPTILPPALRSSLLRTSIGHPLTKVFSGSAFLADKYLRSAPEMIQSMASLMVAPDTVFLMARISSKAKGTASQTRCEEILPWKRVFCLSSRGEKSCSFLPRWMRRQLGIALPIKLINWLGFLRLLTSALFSICQSLYFWTIFLGACPTSAVSGLRSCSSGTKRAPVAPSIAA